MEKSMELEDLREAAAALIRSPKAHEMFEALGLVLPLATNNVPVMLTGDAAVLNPLIALRKTNPNGYEGVIQLVEKRRASLGYGALVKPPDEGYDKTEYMREFMNAKRERERRSAAIENLIRPEQDRLRGNSRIEFMRRQSVTWKQQRDRFLDAARGPHGESLTLEKMRETLARFWDAVDADLTDREMRAKQEALLPVHKRQRPDASLEALAQALEFDPYKK